MGQISIGAYTYDVYGDTDGLKEYMKARVGSGAYDGASSNDRKKAHVSATRWMDRQNWAGQKTDLVTPQPNEFPRTGLSDKDGNPVDGATVPKAVEHATYELVLALLGDSSGYESVDTGSNIKRVQAGSAQVEWFKGTEGGYPTFPPQAHDLVKIWMEGHGGFTGAWSGDTESESEFDGYGLGQGYA